MKAPLAACPPETTLADAFARMDGRRIGSLVVVTEADRLAGVLTYAGLARAVLEQGAAPGDDVMRVACEQPFTVAPETPLWEVEQLQQTHGLKYVIVAEAGRPLGMISQTDIVRALTGARRAVPAEVAGAPSLGALARVRAGVPELAARQRETNRRAAGAVQVINDYHLAVQRRCIELTQAELEAEGLGAPPAEYAFVIMGSGGRGEMLLEPDQDNGLIVADEVDEAGAGWFQAFAERVNLHLDAVGYPLCPGDIMARSPRFRKTLAEWRRQVSHIAAQPTPKAARWANVALDFDLLYGSRSLVEALMGHVLAELGARPRLLSMMVQDDAEGRPPLGLFNRLRTEKDQEKRGKIDLKRNGLRILADGARIYALRAGVAARGTQERLTGAVRQGMLEAEHAESVKAAHEALTALLLDHQLRQARAGRPVDKLLTLATRSPLEQETLRMAMRMVKGFQEKLQADFGTLVF
jgi:CBS domain-containing protein